MGKIIVASFFDWQCILVQQQQPFHHHCHRVVCPMLDVAVPMSVL